MRWTYCTLCRSVTPTADAAFGAFLCIWIQLKGQSWKLYVTADAGAKRLPSASSLAPLVCGNMTACDKKSHPRSHLRARCSVQLNAQRLHGSTETNAEGTGDSCTPSHRLPVTCRWRRRSYPSPYFRTSCRLGWCVSNSPQDRPTSDGNEYKCGI